MSTPPFSFRIPPETVDRIRQQFPDFNEKKEGDKKKQGDKKRDGVNTKVLLELVERGLGTDPSQQLQEQLAAGGEELRDLRAEVRQLRQNLSVVLELVLMNLSDDQEQAERIIKQLKKRGGLC